MLTIISDYRFLDYFSSFSKLRCKESKCGSNNRWLECHGWFEIYIKSILRVILNTLVPLVGVGEVCRAAIVGSERAVSHRAPVAHPSMVVVALRPTLILLHIILNSILESLARILVPFLAVFILVNMSVNVTACMGSRWWLGIIQFWVFGCILSIAKCFTLINFIVVLWVTDVFALVHTHIHSR